MAASPNWLIVLTILATLCFHFEAFQASRLIRSCPVVLGRWPQTDAIYPQSVIHVQPLHRQSRKTCTITAKQHKFRLNLGQNSNYVFSAMAILRGGAEAAFELDELFELAYTWLTNLGAPAALVAGAVIATIYENLNSDEYQVKKNDKKWVAFGKKFVRLLLLSAFAMEVLSIFVTTVTGTMLLSKTVSSMARLQKTGSTTPLSFLRDNFELEFLTARITFLQGLLNWMFAISLSHFIPLSNNTPTSTRKFNKFIDRLSSVQPCLCWLFTISI